MTVKPAIHNQTPAQPRMKLSTITRGKLVKPPRVLIFGPEGCGKTTWAANAPSPIFLCAEDGTAQLDVARFPEPQSWTDVLDAINELTTGDHDFKTLVVDTLDWLEPLCWDHVCKRDGVKDIEAYGYSKGQNVVALNEWRILVSYLERLCRAREMGVIMIAHCWVKTYKNPEADDYDRFELAIHNKAGGLLKQWCDAVLFARFETFADKDSKTKRVRGVSTGARVLHTERTAAYDAKNRYDLPPIMPLDYGAFAEAVSKHTPADPVKLTARIETLLASADDEITARVRAALEKAQGDAAQLARIADHLAATVNINQQENAQ